MTRKGWDELNVISDLLMTVGVYLKRLTVIVVTLRVLFTIIPGAAVLENLH